MIHLSLRLQDPLHADLLAAAAEDTRSLNGTIVHLLTLGLAVRRKQNLVTRALTGRDAAEDVAGDPNARRAAPQAAPAAPRAAPMPVPPVPMPSAPVPPAPDPHAGPFNKLCAVHTRQPHNPWRCDHPHCVGSKWAAPQ